jgi:hypothetical protein
LVVAVACALNISSVAYLTYQTRTLRSIGDLIEGVRGLIEDIFYYPLSSSGLGFELLVNYGIWLAPTVAVLLLRRYWAVAACYALVLFPILLGRIYYALQRMDGGQRPSSEGRLGVMGDDIGRYRIGCCDRGLGGGGGNLGHHADCLAGKRPRSPSMSWASEHAQHSGATSLASSATRYSPAALKQRR